MSSVAIGAAGGAEDAAAEPDEDLVSPVSTATWSMAGGVQLTRGIRRSILCVVLRQLSRDCAQLSPTAEISPRTASDSLPAVEDPTSRRTPMFEDIRP